MEQMNTDNSQACFRTSRMFREENYWFFKTREGKTVGPFQDELDASTQLEIYIRLVNSGLLPLEESLRQAPLAKNIAR